MSDSLWPHGLSGSSVHGILQARILEGVASSFSKDLPDPGIEPRSPILQAGFLPPEPPGKPILILLKTAEMNNPVVVLVKKSRSFVKAKIYRLYVA